MLLVPLLVMGLALAWTYRCVRAVMAVGGTCADGGPYVGAEHCPPSPGFAGFAIPLLLVAAFVGSFVGVSLAASNLVVPM